MGAGDLSKLNVEKMKAEKAEAEKDVKGLIKALDYEEIDVRANAARALGEIGDVKAIQSLCWCIINAPYALHGEMKWDYYDTLMPIVAEVLANMGEPAVPQLIKRLKESASVLMGVPIIWALCDVGNRKAAEAVVDWIFKVGPESPTVPLTQLVISDQGGKPISPPDLIRFYVPTSVLPKLLGDYTDVILDVFAWRAVMDSGQFDISRCSEAIQRLCTIKTPISSNILHKVLSIKMLVVSFQRDNIQSRTEYLNFKPQMQIAKDELKSRGKPRYDPSAYLNQDAWRI